MEDLRQSLNQLIQAVLTELPKGIIDERIKQDGNIPLKKIDFVPGSYSYRADRAWTVALTHMVWSDSENLSWNLTTEGLFSPESEAYEAYLTACNAYFDACPFPNPRMGIVWQSFLKELCQSTIMWLDRFRNESTEMFARLFPSQASTATLPTPEERRAIAQQLQDNLAELNRIFNERLAGLKSGQGGLVMGFWLSEAFQNLDRTHLIPDKFEHLLAERWEDIRQLAEECQSGWVVLNDELQNICERFFDLLKRPEFLPWNIKVWLQGVIPPEASRLSLNVGQDTWQLDGQLSRPQALDFTGAINRTDMEDEINLGELPLPPHFPELEHQERRWNIRCQPLPSEYQSRLGSTAFPKAVEYPTSAIFSGHVSARDAYEVLDSIEILVQTMRLYSVNTVAWERIEARCGYYGETQLRQLSDVAFLSERLDPASISFHLEENQNEKLQIFINLISPLVAKLPSAPDHLFRIALSRYNEALLLPWGTLPSHRLSLAVSCLEVLLMEDGISSQISETFARRCQILFGQFDELRYLPEILYKLDKWREVYDIRSRYVHGNALVSRSGPERQRDLLGLALQTARIALLVALQKEIGDVDSKRQFLSELDSSNRCYFEGLVTGGSASTSQIIWPRE